MSEGNATIIIPEPEEIDKMNNCCSLCDCLCYHKFEDWWKAYKTKIAGKVGIGLSILNSIFIVLDAHYPASAAKYIVAALISAGVFIGGLMYDRLARDHKQLEDDNVSLKQSKEEIIRRFTLIPHYESNETPAGSEDTIQPVNFEAIHRNNVFHSAITEYTFPDSE